MLIPIIKESERNEETIKVSWDIAYGSDNWVVQFWKVGKDNKHELITQLDKNSDSGGSMEFPLSKFSSQLALLEGLKKEVEELPPAVVDQVESGDLSEWITKKSVISSLEESITYLKTKI